MMLDNVYGSAQDRFPPEQESEHWAEECPSLEWEETELPTLAQVLEECPSLEWEETEIRTLARDLSGPRLFAE